MKIDYTFHITIEVADPVADASGVEPTEEWKRAVRETCQEFGEELNAFLDKHPLVIACRFSEKK